MKIDEEILELLKDEVFNIVTLKDLNDYGNEQVFNIVIDYPEDTVDNFDAADKHYHALGDKLKTLIDNELNCGDYTMTLEAEFTTNNHYIFIVSKLK